MCFTQMHRAWQVLSSVEISIVSFILNNLQNSNHNLFLENLFVTRPCKEDILQLELCDEW